MPTADTTIAILPFFQWDTTTADSVYEVHEVDLGIPLDSIFPAIDRPEPQMRQTLFTNHGMAVQHEQPIARHSDAAPAWAFGLLIMLTVLTFVYYNSRKIRFSELLKSTIDHHATDRLVRSCNMGRPLTLAPIGFLLTAVLAVVGYHAAMAHTGPIGYLLLAAGLAVGYILRNGVIRLLGNIFGNQDAVASYTISNYLYHLVLTTALIPMLFLFIYMPWGNEIVLYIIVALVALSFIMRISRGIKVFLTSSRDHSFYLFYYLCTVEIVPILILIKLFIE